MKNIDTIYQKYQDIKNLPNVRKAELASLISELEAKEKEAQKAFTDAENDGIDSSELFTFWQSVKKELDLTRARYNALDVSKLGKELPKVAAELYEEANKQIEKLDKDKSKLEADMKALQDSFTEVFIAYSDTQAEQNRIAKMVNEDARKLFSSMYVSPNYLRTAETLPIPTIEGLRKKVFFHVNGKEISA
jgi:chromosome segregation ATPase